MNIYPNPFTHSTTIQFTNPDNSRYNLLVYDVSGKLVYTEGYIFTDRVEFSREQLPAGLYIVELRGNRIYRGRMVIE